MPHTTRVCVVCGSSLTGRRAQQVCSARCRIARWRQTRALETAGEIARYQAENTALRQRVAELERLVGRLKERLWGTG
jgi:predicted nucleic acid-binding Zn ribbon protein